MIAWIETVLFIVIAGIMCWVFVCIGNSDRDGERKMNIPTEKCKYI